MTDNGTTTPLPVDDGIATGVASPTAALSIDIAGVTHTTQLRASTGSWWPPAAPVPATTSSSSTA